MASKAQQRNKNAEKDTLELIQQGYIRPSQKVAGRELALACGRAEERTKPTKNQKPAYVGVEFNFPSRFDMATYIITELPKDWEHAQELKVLRQNAKGKEAKSKLVITIDRINEGTAEQRGHYERGNIQIMSNEANRAKSAQKKRRPRVMFGNSGYGTELVVGESITATAEIQGVSHATAKRYSYPYTRLEAGTEAERKVQAKENGITYQTPQERAESDKRMLASITAKQPQ